MARQRSGEWLQDTREISDEVLEQVAKLNERLFVGKLFSPTELIDAADACTRLAMMLSEVVPGAEQAGPHLLAATEAWEWFRTPETLDDLELSTRAHRDLHRIGIETLDELLSYSAADLVSRKMTKKMVRQVQDNLAKFGLALLPGGTARDLRSRR